MQIPIQSISLPSVFCSHGYPHALRLNLRLSDSHLITLSHASHVSRSPISSPKRSKRSSAWRTLLPVVFVRERLPVVEIGLVVQRGYVSGLSVVRVQSDRLVESRFQHEQYASRSLLSAGKENGWNSMNDIFTPSGKGWTDCERSAQSTPVCIMCGRTVRLCAD